MGDGALWSGNHSVANRNNLALKRPVFRLFNQSRANRVLMDIVPFFGVALAMAQNVVEESGLPMGLWSRDHGGQGSFQQPDSRSDLVLRGDAYEAVDMIRHNDIATKRNALGFGLRRKVQPFPVYRLVVQHLLAVEGREGNEVDWCVVGLENMFKPTRFSGLAFHS